MGFCPSKTAAKKIAGMTFIWMRELYLSGAHVQVSYGRYGPELNSEALAAVTRFAVTHPGAYGV